MDGYCYNYPYMYYMVEGDDPNQCILKIEKPERSGFYLIPLDENGQLYSTYLVEYIRSGVLFAATAHKVPGQNYFEVVFACKKTTFGTFDNKVHQYGGKYTHPDFKYGFAEVGINDLAELFAVGNIQVIGCDAKCHCHEKVPKIDLNAKSIFLTGGIGDIFAIDSFLSDDIKSNIETICYATKQSQVLQKLFSVLPCYNIKKHVVVWDDFSERPYIANKADCQSDHPEFLNAVDFGIFTIFPQFAAGHVAYNKSSWLNYKLSDISIDLPIEYVVICPYASSNFRNLDGSIYEGVSRNLLTSDWEEVIRFLERKKITGVVLNDKREPVPDHPSIIDCSGQTDIFESIEILKKGKYFIGADSSFSILAAKLFDVQHLMIKIVLMHGISWKYAYWAPHTDFSFLQSAVKTNHLE